MGRARHNGRGTGRNRANPGQPGSVALIPVWTAGTNTTYLETFTEASGNLADAVANIPLTAVNTSTYRVPGIGEYALFTGVRTAANSYFANTSANAAWDLGANGTGNFTIELLLSTTAAGGTLLDTEAAASPYKGWLLYGGNTEDELWFWGRSEATANIDIYLCPWSVIADGNMHKIRLTGDTTAKTITCHVDEVLYNTANATNLGTDAFKGNRRSIGAAAGGTYVTPGTYYAVKITHDAATVSPPPQGAISNVTATALPDADSTHWAALAFQYDAADRLLVSYEVEYQAGSAAWAPLSTSTITAANATHFTCNASGFASDVVYGFRVRASRPPGGSTAYVVSDPATLEWATPNVGDPSGINITINGVSYGINAHPRISMNAALLSALQTRSVATVNNKSWTQLRTYNNAHSPVTTSYYPTYGVCYAIEYLANGDTDCRDDALRIIDNIISVNDPNIGESSFTNATDYGSITLQMMALLYDYMYNDMSVAQREGFRNYVFTTAINTIRQHPANHRDPAVYYEYGHNLCQTKWAGEMMWGLATMGDDYRGDEFVTYNWDYYLTKLLPLFETTYNGGYTYSGTNYGFNRIWKYLCHVWEAAETALADFTAFPEWAEEHLKYWLYATLPGATYFHCENESSYVTWSDGRELEHVGQLVRKYSANDSAKMFRYFIENEYSFSTRFINNIYVGNWHLYHDTAQANVDYSTLPLSHVCNGTQVGFSRDAWADDTGWWACFQGQKYITYQDAYGNYNRDHQTIKDGSYKVFHNGRFAIIENASKYAVASGGSALSTDPTRAGMVFVGNGAVTGGTITGGYYRISDYSSNAVIQNHYSANTAVSYMQVNVKGSYHPTYFPMDYALRNFCHFRPASGSDYNYLVVMDAFKSNASQTKTVQFFTPAAPTIASNVATFALTNSDVTIAALDGTMSSEAVTDYTSGITQGNTDVPTKVKIDFAAGTAMLCRQVILVANTGAVMPTLTALADVNVALKGVWIHDESQPLLYLGSVSNAAVAGSIAVDGGATFSGTKCFVSGVTPNQRYTALAASTYLIMTAEASGGNCQADANGNVFFVLA